MNRAERLDTAADWLQRLQSAPHDEAVVAEWTQWCQADPDNLAAFEEIEAVWAALDAPQARFLRATSLSYSASAQSVRSPRVSGHIASRVRMRISRPWTIAASLLIAIGLAAASYWTAVVRDAQILQTHIAEHESRVLEDGSRVDLGGRTRLTARYSDRQRSVTMDSGEAFFQVAKDPLRPFTVRAGALEIIAVGTAFSVRHLSDRTTVTVTEGLVRIRSLADRDEAKPVALEAQIGEKVAFDDVTSELQRSHVDSSSAGSWRDGILKFVDEPLGAVVDDVNRYAQRRIELDDPALRRRLYTGTIYQDRIEDWVSALEEVFPIEAVAQDDQISLVRKPR